MNLYCLAEGRRTERKVYPQWLSILLPKLSEVRFAHEVSSHSYYIFSGNGYPSILDNHLVNAVCEVSAIGRFNYLVMCIDADEMEVHERRREVHDFMATRNLELLGGTRFVLIVQNRCIETWCLGNKRVYKKNPSSELLKSYMGFYNVRDDDPELMGRLEPFETHAQFHAEYLAEMLQARNIRYTKKNPQGVVEAAYLQELINRTTQTSHIQTFGEFLSFCSLISSQLT